MYTLYPELEPYHSGYIETCGKHRVYVEQSGNPEGLPVVFLHGGPCSGTHAGHRRFFDPQKYRIILFDQRGCGQSLPFGELEDNTTQTLLDDIERIRTCLDIEQWLVFGGSWGGTLALLYAQAHPARVLGLVIRGVFLAREKDLDWFVKEGVGRVYPEQWRRLTQCIPEAFAHDPVQGLCQVLWGDDELARMRAVLAWQAWSAQVALGEDYRPETVPSHVTHKMLQQVRMELHYARHGYFIEENRILKNCAAIAHIPTVIIHGRRDLMCPLEAGWSLQQALPQARFIALPKAGHIAQGEAMIDALVSAVETLANTVEPA
ncbi:MAG: prolyl aminopeptidase [Gammaproteobacteria bacterium HGW-Gammaproteobacteria-3]|nr:MAG: prolyl aminopeptidase [Gammaproteobacteria bacterium HGW-Gammaproteobacteria-3]